MDDFMNGKKSLEKITEFQMEQVGKAARMLNA
jgi:hypothetical protein